MSAARLVEKLSYVAAHTGEEEAAVLARVFDAGVETLYREAVIDAYLAGECGRDELVLEVGQEAAMEIDLRRQAILGDFRWGLAGA